MAAYKVPQDVEAEDKLVGWLTFRQFIYLLIAGGATALAFFMVQVFPPLILIPLPFILLFGTLALPLKKDQPLETYLLAVIRFYLKPKTRKWDPDGTISYVEITAPKSSEHHLAKEYGGETAKERLDYLARIMDSRGWAYKGVESPMNESISPTVAAEAQSAVDVLDEQAELSRSFEDLIAKKAQQQRQDVIQQMQRAQTPGGGPPQDDHAGAVSSQTTFTDDDDAPLDDTTTDDATAPHFNPYPTAIHQKVVLPMNEQRARAKLAAAKAKKQDTTAMTPPVSPDIMRLASNDDLSISALAHEAHRLEAKDGEEVVINLH